MCSYHRSRMWHTHTQNTVTLCVIWLAIMIKRVLKMYDVSHCLCIYISVGFFLFCSFSLSRGVSRCFVFGSISSSSCQRLTYKSVFGWLNQRFVRCIVVFFFFNAKCIFFRRKATVSILLYKSNNTELSEQHFPYQYTTHKGQQQKKRKKKRKQRHRHSKGNP